MTLLFIATAGLVCACGTYLLLGRQLSRVVVGIALIGHGVNILLLLSGGAAVTPRSSAATRSGSRTRCPKP